MLWAIFGEPSKDIADMFWENSAAPWELVDAYYYPDRNDLTNERSAFSFESLEDCRDWVFSQARNYNDSQLIRGDYECGVGFLENFGQSRVYRITVR